MSSVVWKAEPGEGKLNRLVADERDGSCLVQLRVKKGEVEWKSLVRTLEGVSLAVLSAAVANMPPKWVLLREEEGPPYLALRIWPIPGTALMLYWRVNHPAEITRPEDIGDEFKITKLEATAEWKLRLIEA
jgi:hypothetical protein